MNTLRYYTRSKWVQVSIVAAVPQLIAIPVSYSYGRTSVKNEVVANAKAEQDKIDKREADDKTFKDGLMVVSKDIQPGTYKTYPYDLLGGQLGCRWNRLDGTDSKKSGEIGIGRANVNEPSVVTIKDIDKAFSSQGFGLWHSDLSQHTTINKTSFKNGTFMVGADVEPGVYTSESSQSSLCFKLLPLTLPAALDL